MMVCAILEAKERLEMLSLLLCQFFKISSDFDRNRGCIILEAEKLLEMFLAALFLCGHWNS